MEVTASVDAPVENGGSSSEDVADVTGTVESPLASETYLHETTALLPGPPETVALELSTSAYAMNTLMQDQDCMEHKERHWNETNFRTAFDGNSSIAADTSNKSTLCLRRLLSLISIV